MILEMRDICKDYALGKAPVHVLKHVDLQVDHGEYVAIMGPSGSGKTTLMNLIGCLDVPTSGEYILDGQSIPQCNDNQLAEIRNKKIGFVFQSFHLLPRMSAVENVALPLLYAGVSKKERRERAIAALEMVGLAERLDFQPDQLSGGQCQRVAIARAMVTNPQLLLADEPTTALDVTIQAQILQLLKKINREYGTAILFISHNLNVVRKLCSEILVMHKGIIVERGSTEDIFFRPKEDYTQRLIAAIPTRTRRLY